MKTPQSAGRVNTRNVPLGCIGSQASRSARIGSFRPWVAAVPMLWLASAAPGQQPATIPSVQATALDGHTVALPSALPGRATVLILGFGRRSQDATTAWEKPVRTQLAHTPAVGFFDMAMLAEIPGFLHGVVLRSIHKSVPPVLQPNFLPLFDHEEEWKRVAGYSADQPEAAYVLLVDAQGRVRWSTHQAFTPAGFAQLSEQARTLAGR